MCTLDVNTWGILVKFRAYNHAASCSPVLLHRSKGGRGLEALTFVWETEILSSALYLKQVADQHAKGTVVFVEDYERNNRDRPYWDWQPRCWITTSLLREAEPEAEDDRPLAKIARVCHECRRPLATSCHLVLSMNGHSASGRHVYVLLI